MSTATAVRGCDLSAVKEAAQLLRRSYELVFGKLTKKLQREISGA
jgi:predicted DNA-binding protein (MmcQ/YjbR family)